MISRGEPDFNADEMHPADGGRCAARHRDIVVKKDDGRQAGSGC